MQQRPTTTLFPNGPKCPNVRRWQKCARYAEKQKRFQCARVLFHNFFFPLCIHCLLDDIIVRGFSIPFFVCTFLHKFVISFGQTNSSEIKRERKKVCIKRFFPVCKRWRNGQMVSGKKKKEQKEIRRLKTDALCT